jgi:hypothetical protein
MLNKTLTGVEIALSAKGLRNLPKNVYENDFTFIVDKSCYHCPSFLASFLSPRICRLQMKDPTLREFHIETDDPTDLFETILEVCYGSSFRVCENISFFKSIFCELGNRELYEQLFGQFSDDLTILNVVDRLEFLFSTNESCEREIEFCSSHFYEIDSKTISSLSFELISSIISNSSIRLKDEESLYELISFRQNEDSQFSSLYSHIRFEYLSTTSMSSFIQLITNSFDFLTFPIWCSLCSRLSLSVLIDCSNDRFFDEYSSVVCPFQPPLNLDGLISYLTKRFGGHVIDRDIVSITASSFHHSQSYPIRNIANLQDQSIFHSSNEANAWICYDFKDRRIKVIHYSIRARCDYDGYYLRSWTLEGSKDGLSWVKIDDRTNDTSLNYLGVISTFSISSDFQNEFRMIRLRMTGKDSSGTNHIVVSAIEFFGVLKELKQ